MKLDEFIELLHIEVEEFRQYWIENSIVSEDQFPLNMEENDWFEQVGAYNEIMEE
jgi:hypothetical protein